MTLSLRSLADRVTGHAGAAPGDRGMAGALANLAYAAIRPLRYRMHYQRILGELARLDDDLLSDIGSRAGISGSMPISAPRCAGRYALR